MYINISSEVYFDFVTLIMAQYKNVNKLLIFTAQHLKKKKKVWRSNGTGCSVVKTQCLRYFIFIIGFHIAVGFS